MVPANINSQRYEYAIESVRDNSSGGTDFAALTRVIDNRAKNGWRLITVHTNELGVNSVSYGGFGTNATIDQTILIFERELPKQEQHAFDITAPVPDSNIVKPFTPKTVRFFGSNGHIYVTLNAFCGTSFSLGGLQGDLAVRNVFGDEAVLEDVCFFSFNHGSDGFAVSSAFPVQLPDKISHGVASAALRVKRYIGNGQLVLPEDQEIKSIAQVQADAFKEMTSGNGSAFQPDVILGELSSLASARDIYTRVLEYNKTASIFDEEMLVKLAEMVKFERAYGNSKKSALKIVTTYLETLTLTDTMGKVSLKKEEPVAVLPRGQVAIMEKARALGSAQEIYDLITAIDKVDPTEFSEQLLYKMSRLSLYERTAENCKADAIGYLEKFYAEKNKR